MGGRYIAVLVTVVKLPLQLLEIFCFATIARVKRTLKWRMGSDCSEIERMVADGRP
jgi:hypothetical protein